VKEADYVIMESTYGDRSHEKPKVDYATELAAVIQRTLDRGGNVVIPSFAVGRTQEMLYFIRMIKEQKLVKGHDGFEVWVDSPLANEATNIFRERMYSDFDEEAKALLERGINPIGFEGLKTSITSADSIAINNDTKPKVILSASGMCDAGRIKHHLKHNLWREECTVLFVGYQAAGTLGRSLIEGAPEVKVFGERIEVKAEICRLPGISGHADNEGLMRWISAFTEKPQKVFVVHGEDTVCDVFTSRLRQELGLDAYAPFSGTEFDLARGQITYEAAPIRIRKETAADITATARVTKTFARLLAAGQRLIGIIRKNEGGANKDIDRFTREINELCDKWER
jgi:metallo-beta-lactamase family protein